jgi:energy-coupling factor transporter ATP-binding protein EcfA2
MSAVTTAATQSLSVGRDARGVIQLTGSRNVIYVIASDATPQLASPTTHEPYKTIGLLGTNPYRSLDPFDEGSSEIFFGRADLTAKLLSRLEIQAKTENDSLAPGRLLAVMGPSGCGKSSVVRAGLVPAIANSEVRRLQGAEVAIFQPGRRPIAALASVLARTITRDPAPVAKTAEFEKEIRGRASDGTHTGITSIARARGSFQTPLIIIVDQFEEVYTLVRPLNERDNAAVSLAKAERAAFVRTLLQAASEPGAGVFVVLTLRTDFYGVVAEHPDASAAISASHELVSSMTAAELRDAIERPARLHGLELSDPVVEKLIEQALENPSALPLVQHALFRFWNAMTAASNDPPKQTAAYRILDDLGGAMAATARELMAELPSDVPRSLAWSAFLRGVQLGEGVRDTRRRFLLSEILPMGTSAEELRAALRPFVRERLLSMD